MPGISVNFCENRTRLCHSELPVAPYPVMPAQAGIQGHPQRVAGVCAHDCPAMPHAHGARGGAVWVPACAGTTREVKFIPKAVELPSRCNTRMQASALTLGTVPIIGSYQGD